MKDKQSIVDNKISIALSACHFSQIVVPPLLKTIGDEK